MRAGLPLAAAFLALAALPAWAEGPRSQTDCAALAALALPHATVTLAEARHDGTFHENVDIDGKPFVHTGLPAFCRVTARPRRSPGSKIGFEVWLPLEGWSGRLHMVGQRRLQRSYLLRPGGRAAAQRRCRRRHRHRPRGRGPEVRRGPSRAHRRLGRSRHSRECGRGQGDHGGILRAGPRAVLFQRLLDGGHQALSEAERYPADFDGIIAGDPGNNRTNLNLLFLWDFLKNHRRATTARRSCRTTSSAWCARRRRGVRRARRGKDGVINDPRQCKFDVGDARLQRRRRARLPDAAAGRGGEGDVHGARGTRAPASRSTPASCRVARARNTPRRTRGRAGAATGPIRASPTSRSGSSSSG